MVCGSLGNGGFFFLVWEGNVFLRIDYRDVLVMDICRNEGVLEVKERIEIGLRTSICWVGYSVGMEWVFIIFCFFVFLFRV